MQDFRHASDRYIVKHAILASLSFCDPTDMTRRDPTALAPHPPPPALPPGYLAGRVRVAVPHQLLQGTSACGSVCTLA